MVPVLCYLDLRNPGNPELKYIKSTDEPNKQNKSNEFESKSSLPSECNEKADKSILQEVIALEVRDNYAVFYQDTGKHCAGPTGDEPEEHCALEIPIGDEDPLGCTSSLFLSTKL